MASTYITKSGDTWDIIAYNQLGSCKYTSLLMEANIDLLENAIFSAGCTLVLPEITANNSTNIPPWRRES